MAVVDVWQPSRPRPKVNERLFRRKSAAFRRLLAWASSRNTALCCLTVTCWASYCSESIAAAVLGSLLPSVAKHSMLGLAEIAVLVPCFNAGCALGSTLGGRAFDGTLSRLADGERQAVLYGVDAVPRAAVMMLSFLMFGIAVCNLPFGIARGRNALSAACCAHGVFNGAFRTGANWVMLRLYPPEKGAPYLYAMHSFSGVGRFLASLLGVLFGDTAHVYVAFWLSAVVVFLAGISLCVVSVAVSATQERVSFDHNEIIMDMSLPLLLDKSGGKPIEQATVASVSVPAQLGADDERRRLNNMTGMVSLFAFLTMGLQNSFQYLVTSYAVAASPPLPYSQVSQAAMLSVMFGLSFAIGRLLLVPLSTRFTAISMLSVSSAVACGSVAFITLFPFSAAVLKVGSIATGFALSAMFPATLNYAKCILGCEMCGGRLSIIMFASMAGGIVIPQCAGQMLQPHVASATSVVNGNGRMFENLRRLIGIRSEGPEAMMDLLLKVCLCSGFVLLVSAILAFNCHLWFGRKLRRT
eukprot:TRINITY_DN38444_c0_g1_i1.p1 TRINITY_DN38444_c0_g1~~TRINITY_DN38444_c0_g1_i1.p1  ORF type:complete len:545 (-),score=45.07 TRINITY_DN38444_c0_g1_i1:343-1920(-)